MKEHSKRWLMSRLKTSGSKRKYLANGRYADDRHLWKAHNLETLPVRESIGRTQEFYNGKIHYGLLVRFLRTQAGNNWDEVYAEALNRIPTKLLDYREIIFWFVADKVEHIEGRVWNKETQKFIWMGEPYILRHYSEMRLAPEFREFYVDPATNKLVHIPQRSSKRISVSQ